MTLRLSDLCQAIIDCEHKTAPDGDGFALSVGTRGMKNGRLVVQACKSVSEETYVDWTRRMTPVPGDLVLAREAPVGQVIRVPNGPLICLGQRTVLIRPDRERIHPRFLHYWLLGPDAQGRMAAQAGGATVAHLNVEDIRNLDVRAIPEDPQVQEWAATVLGAIDDLIETNVLRVRLLEDMARTIYRQWFARFRYPGHEDDALVDSALGRIPNGWKAAKLRELATEVRRSVQPSSDTALLPYVPIDSIDSKSLTLRTFRPGSEAASSLRLFEKGDVLFGAMRAYFHKVCVAPFGGITRSTCFVLRPEPRLYWYSVLTLADSETVKYAAAHSSGSTIPYAKWEGVLSEMPTVVPPVSLIAPFADSVAPLLQMAQSIAEQALPLEILRDLLLPKLVTGNIDVSGLDLDATDAATA